VVRVARCGCSSTCGCCLTAGTGVTITGTGNTGSCYVISSTGGVLTVMDTPSVNETLTGSGTLADPYVLSSAVIIDPEPTNVLTSGPAGLDVSCARVIACVSASPGTTGVTVADGNGLDLSISGTGAAGNPYVISGVVVKDPNPDNILTVTAAGVGVTCESVQDCIGQAIAAGQGATYNDAGNAISVLPSTDVGNQVVSGTDGRLFVPAAGAGVTPVTVTDTPCSNMTLTGNGTAPTPWNISSDPIIAPSTPCAANKLTCTPTGLLARQTAPALKRATNGLVTRASVVMGGRTVSQIDQADFTVTTYDTGTAVGVWTVNANGSVTVSCNGVYDFQEIGAALKNGGNMRGQQIRMFVNGTAVDATADWRDFTNTADISTVGDGPEDTIATTLKLNAGDVITWRYFVDVLPAGQSADMNGQMHMVYLGENP
jgi:hypothetical protein